MTKETKENKPTLGPDVQLKIIKAYNDLMTKVIVPNIKQVVEYCVDIGIIDLPEGVKGWDIVNIGVNDKEEIESVVGVVMIDGQRFPIHFRMSMSELNGDWKAWADNLLKEIEEKEAVASKEQEEVEKQQRLQLYQELRKEFGDAVPDPKPVSSEPAS